ncbi:MAG: PDZ domain-containing protein [Actinobacteria bacterium]|nr:PDZ domain-containing protein [Actinomycetota bacterium]
MNRYRLLLPLAAISATSLLVGFTTAQATSSHSSNGTAVAASPATALQNAFVSVYKRVSKSVVQIENSSGLGSGIVFDKKGNIVTNYHVVSGSTTFTVTTSSGRQLKGTLVGTFPEDDLAVIHVAGANLAPAAFADSSKLEVGDIAMAIGNPLGLQSSFTEGVVSALGRNEPEGNGYVLRNAIQTSAAINPGNSGGALVDIEGRVIGIPTLAASDPQLGGAAAGIGFAIPSSDVVDIAKQIIQNGHVVNSNRAYLGIQVGDTGAGVYVGAVTAGGPAAKAGLVVGDVITSVNGKATASSDELGTVLAGLKPLQTVTVKVTHQSGATAAVRVTLGEYPGASG